ncbi:MAG: hypothetical protein ACRDTN_14895 [Mycobacterium sp.]
MLGAIAIMPSAPVLVPELAGTAAAELAGLRAAVFAAAASLPSPWVAVGAGPIDAVFGPDSVGTFAGFGVDVAVRLSPQAEEPADLPLCALMTGWVRGQAQPDARVQAHVYADPDTAAARGKQLRAEIERSPGPIGALVVADGANTLTAAAPGGYHPRDVDLQRALDDALARGDVGALAGLPGQIVGRVAFAVLAGLAGPGPRSTKELYRGAPYGVGYFAGVWQP